MPIHGDLALEETGEESLAEQHLRIAMVLENNPQRRRNLARRESAGRHLIQQRLKQVEIAAIDSADKQAKRTTEFEVE